MSEKKFQIFISSTFEDLKEERDVITKYILEMGHIPVGMEMFSAADEEQWRIIQKHIEEIDYYIVLVAYRYGSETPEGISYTEKEYDYAISCNVPTLGFIIDKAASWDQKFCDKNPEQIEKLKNFKSKIQKKLVKYWASKDDLAGKVAMALGKAFSASPRPGWVRNINQSDNYQVTEEIARLSKENNEYRDKIKELEGKLQLNESNEKLINELKKITHPVSFFYEGHREFEDTAQIKLINLFYGIAPELVNEATEERISNTIALNFCSSDKYHSLRAENPIPVNYRAAILADLHLLGLIEPLERKNRSTKDKNKYWRLAAKGKEIQLILRKMIIEKNVKKVEDKANNETDEASITK